MSPAELLTIASGLAAGAAHVVLGPDHLAAVLPFAARRPRAAARVGLSWGLGHGGGVLLLGGLGQLLKEHIDLGATSNYAELAAGLLLAALGVWTLYRTRIVVVHTHDHAHGEGDHAHPHVHVGDETVGRPGHAQAGRHERHVHSAFLFGGLHGVAGTSHLLGVLPSLMLSGWAAWLYLGFFILGSVAGMTLFAWLAGRTVGRWPQHLRWSLRFAGTFALAVGCFWIAQFSIS